MKRTTYSHQSQDTPVCLEQKPVWPRLNVDQNGAPQAIGEFPAAPFLTSRFVIHASGFCTISASEASSGSRARTNTLISPASRHHRIVCIVKATEQGHGTQTHFAACPESSTERAASISFPRSLHQSTFNAQHTLPSIMLRDMLPISPRFAANSPHPCNTSPAGLNKQLCPTYHQLASRMRHNAQAL
ncbi:hypothetical protein GY45DRAFT_1066747 [Cubamyces sp. BRFM 1775]|nr:hypothetical protein GY45DRAFT_1066747 [Cubamyces sp. BRFM 1775]